MEENKKITLDDLKESNINTDSETVESSQLSAADIAKRNAEAYRKKKMQENIEFKKAYDAEQAQLEQAIQEEHMRKVATGEDKAYSDKEFFAGLFDNVQNTIERKKVEKEIVDQAREEAEDDDIYVDQIPSDYDWKEDNEDAVDQIPSDYGWDEDGDDDAVDQIPSDYDWKENDDDDDILSDKSQKLAPEPVQNKEPEVTNIQQMDISDDLKGVKNPESSLKDALYSINDEDDDDDDEDEEELQPNEVKDINGEILVKKEYKTQDEWFDALGEAAKDKMKLIDDHKVIDLSQFTVASNTVSLKTAIRVTTVEANPNVSNWALFNTGLPITMSEFKGQELAKLTGGDDQNRYTRNRELMKLIYNHDMSDSKPKTFIDWLKQISVRDNDHLYMAIYKACYSGSNYIPYSCDHCGEIFVTDNIDISEMVKYGSPEDKAKAEKLVNSALREPEPLKVVREQISDRYVMDFKDPSLYDYFIENSVLNDKFVLNNRDLITYMCYIDNIYVIDYAHKSLIPINLVKYDKDISKEVNSKVKRYSKILKELSDNELSKIESVIHGLLDDTINVSYVLPEQICPRCGRKIEEQAAQAQDLVFTRHQLGRLVTT